jgi:hypothetical protein
MFLIVLLACGPEDIGVIDMAILSVIRRWHFREGMPIREIERRTGWLRIEVGKSRKQKRTARQMRADLVMLAFDGGYGCVAAFVRAWKADRQREQQTSGRGTFVPLVFAPGEAFQFDGSKDRAVCRAAGSSTTCARQSVGSGRARPVRSTPALRRWPAMRTSLRSRHKFDCTCSSPSSATRHQDGKRVRSRRTSRMPDIGCGNQCRASPTSMRSTSGSRSAVSRCGVRSCMVAFRAPSLTSGRRK